MSSVSFVFSFVAQTKEVEVMQPVVHSEFSREQGELLHVVLCSSHGSF